MIGRGSLLFAVCSLAASPAPLPGAAAGEERPDVVVADFEAETHGDWTAAGEAFGDGPAAGTLPGQMRVDGFVGDRLVNSYHGGDGSTGTLTSPPFTLSRERLNLLVGGGGFAGETCVNLLVGGEVVRTAVGPNRRPGGSERLVPRSWSLAGLFGKTARVRIVDARRGGWGHVCVDQIVLSDEAIGPPPPVTLEKTLTVDGSHLLVPVSNRDDRGGRVRLGLYAGTDERGERTVQTFDVTLPAGDAPAWTAAYPLDHFDVAGETLTLRAVGGTGPPEIAAAFGRIRVGAAADALDPGDFAEPYRNQFHLAARRGWNNDPNGLVYHDGLWHVFYQFNPFGIVWGNMHWGHYTSPDLVDWTPRPIALFQHGPGDAAFSGGGFVDTRNSAGLGAGTLFVAFTSTGRGECLAFSRDGVTFEELPENPVVTHAGRDPKVFWHEPTARWVMVVYENQPSPETRATPEAAPEPFRPHGQIAFYVSTDLRRWTRTGAFTHPDRRAIYECPELFELPLLKHGEPTGESKWILYGAENRYFVGTFDGESFAAESGPHGDSHGAFYAAQTFNDAPAGRRIQIGWVRTATYPDRFPAQTVNQCLSLPHELTLHVTPEGPRLRFRPVAELENLRAERLAAATDPNTAEAALALAACADELTEVNVEFDRAGRHDLTIDGVDASFEGTSARIFTDRTVTELYVDGGRRYEVRTRPAKSFDERHCRVGAGVQVLTVHRLRSIWPAAPAD